MTDVELFVTARRRDGDQIAVFIDENGSAAYVLFSYATPDLPQLVKFNSTADAMELYRRVVGSWRSKGLLND